MKYKNLKSYLERAKNLLANGDEISLCYCALELRKAIELVIWTQFKDAFCEFITMRAPIDSFRFKEKTQSQSIAKMYDMLKKYCPEYVKHAKNKDVWEFTSSNGNAPTKTDGRTCYIRGELPKRDYKYLSEILHYEKEFYPDGFNINPSKIDEIYKELKFFEKNYTIRIMPVKWNEDNILQDFKDAFGFTF